MKKSIVLLAFLLMLSTLVSVMPAQAYSTMGEPFSNYDKYGYYAYYDFENYNDAANHFEYVTSDASQNSNGLACDPFGFSRTDYTNIDGTGVLKNDNGNNYYHFTTNGTTGNNAIAVLGINGSDGESRIIGDAVEISFRFRMVSGDTSTKLPLVILRRGSAGIYYMLGADGYGNLYSYMKTGSSGAYNKIYTNGNGTTVGGDGKWMDIAFRWYDVTNTYSVFVNGTPVVQSMPLRIDYRDYVTTEYNSDFGVDSRQITPSSNGSVEYRSIEFLRNNVSKKYTYDVDDIKLSRVESAQRGAVYYENSFDGAYEGITRFKNSCTTYAYSGTDYKNSIYTANDDANNKYLTVGSGHSFELLDSKYQQLLQSNFVIDFKVKASVTHTEGYKALLRINDSGVNSYDLLYVDGNGNLYTEKDENARIGAYKLDGSEWLDISVVGIKNTDNAGKFSTFKSSTDKSYSNTCYYFNYYINGKFVGTSAKAQLLEWSNVNKSTTSGFNYTITSYTVGGDVAALDTSALILVDSTTTSKHQIWRDEEGLNYYDVTLDSNGNQTAYSKMSLTVNSSNKDSLCFFADTTFNALIDDIKIYEGTAPEWVYENVNSVNGGTLVSLDFASAVLAQSDLLSLTKSSGADVLGTLCTIGVLGKNIVHKDADYSTLSLNSGKWFDLFVPTPEKIDGIHNFSYSFETTVKNIGFNAEDTSVADYIKLFFHRFENDNADSSNVMMSVDNLLNVYAGDKLIQLYNADGTPAKIDNANWNTLRGDVHYYKGESKTEISFSYYLNGEMLYLEDGSPAYRLNSSSLISSGTRQCFGGSNYRVRYTQMPSGKNLTLDIKDITISAKAKPMYTSVTTEQANINGNVTVIELDLVKYAENADETYDAFSLVKHSGGVKHTLPFVAVNNVLGRLSVNFSDSYYELYDGSGNAITVSDTPVRVAVVYDDNNGVVRYYANGAPAYIYISGKLTQAADLKISDYNFTQLKGVSKSEYVVFQCIGENNAYFSENDYNLNTYNITDTDTAEIVGLQTNDTTNGIRILAGVDTLYYSKLGFELESFVNGVSKGVKNIYGYNVFERIVADGKDLSASQLGYEYISVCVITDVVTDIADDSYVLARAYTEVGGTKHYDEQAKIIITRDGAYFCQDGVLYENDFDSITEPPTNWIKKGYSGSTVDITDSGELSITTDSGTLTNYVLNSYIGYDYIVQGEFTPTDSVADDKYFGVLLRYTGEKSFIIAAIRLNGAGWIQARTSSGGWETIAKFNLSDFALSLEKNKTYTITAAVSGDKISFFLDRVLLAEGTIPEGYEKGKVGVSTSGVSLEIDNLIVNEAESADVLLYRENFDGLTSVPAEWKRHEEASRMLTDSFAMTIENDALVIDDLKSNLTVVALDKAFEYGNFVYEATFTMLADNGTSGSYYMGPVFGLQDNGKCGYLVMRVPNGEWDIQSWHTYDYPVSDNVYFVTYAEGDFGDTALNTSYKYRLVCEDGNMTAYINGRKISECEISDELFLSGKFGIVFRSSEIAVDDVRLYKLIDKYEINKKSETQSLIRVAQFNLGDFSTASDSAGLDGKYGNGTPTTQKEYTDVFKKVGADVWGLQEDSEYFIYSSTQKLSAYDAVYKNALPYYERNFTGKYNSKGLLSGYEIYDTKAIYYPATVHEEHYPDGTTSYDHPWFWTGKIMVDGKEIALVSLHFDWACKIRRNTQIQTVIDFAKSNEYCIIMGDFNPENYINRTRITDENDVDCVNPGSINMYQVDWKKFTDEGFRSANGGKFGVFGTMMSKGSTRSPLPWDNIFVSSNIDIINVEPVYESWMSDHAIVVADLRIN